MTKNIAVVGCGYWGRNLVRNFFEIGGLRAVCDPNREVADELSTRYQVKNVRFEELLADPLIQGVVLAVPAPLHASMAIRIMDAGKHALVEKPLSMNTSEAEDMLRCASKNNVRLMVGHLLQYHPAFTALLELVKSGELGALKYVYSNRLSFGKVRSAENVIWSFAPHDISMVLSLVGEVPEIVKTEASSILQPGISDIATIHMRFKSGMRAHISTSWLHPFKEQKVVVIGDRAMAVFDDTKPWSEKLATYKHVADLSCGTPTLHQADVEHIRVAESEPLKNECQHFMDVVGQDYEPLTNGVEGLAVLKVLSAASLSETRNEPVRLEAL